MSGAHTPARAQAAGRPVLEVLLNALGLGIWAAHFGLIYAVHALACERAWITGRPLGITWSQLAIAGLTVVALGALLLVFRAALRRMGPGPWDDGGEREPRFTAWFAAATAVYSALAVVFQAAPALVLPACG